MANLRKIITSTTIGEIMLPDYMQKLMGEDGEIEIEGHVYKTHSMKSLDFIKFQNMNPPDDQIEERMGDATKATAWVIFVTLKPQTSEMENMTFDTFLEGVDDLFIIKMAPLAHAVIQKHITYLQKKK